MHHVVLDLNDTNSAILQLPEDYAKHNIWKTTEMKYVVDSKFDSLWTFMRMRPRSLIGWEAGILHIEEIIIHNPNLSNS